MANRQEMLRRRLRDLGFDEVRFARVATELGWSRPDGPEAAFTGWLQQGMQADMAWLERTSEKRRGPEQAFPGTQSLIMLGASYWPGARKPASEEKSRPIWARYALYDDYHDTMKSALVAAGRVIEELFGAAPTDYRYYVDTGPVLERAWAARAGLGFIGKNAMLISRQHGNWLFLAAILTKLDLEADEPISKKQIAPTQSGVGLLCGKCTRCMDACPTDALPAPGVLDARRCISYQTIENKGVIPRELRAGIGARVYGCDVCLEVCPWNRFAQVGRRMLLAARDELGELPLRELLELTPERFAEVFRRTPIKRLKLVGLLRNACVVAGNSGDATLLDAVARLARHESSMVRAHAVWAVRRLAGEGAAAMLAPFRAAEIDPAVLAEYDGQL
jgi:epoxyqueuosine reductase